MDSFELKNRRFNASAFIMGIGFLIITALNVLVIFPKFHELNPVFSNEYSSIFFGLGIMIFIWIVFLLLFLLFLFNYQNKKIKVENNLVYFFKKTKLGFGPWVIDKLIDFSKVEQITDRFEIRYVFTGKVVIPIKVFWLIFNMNDNTKQEMSLQGWDITNLKNLLFFLRGKFPKILLNNFILKDNSEKLSGLDQITSK